MNSLNIELKPGSEEYMSVLLSGKISKDGWMPNWDPFLERFGDQFYSKPVMVNLSNVNYVDSTGVEWLLACHTRCCRSGGTLVLHSPSPMASQLFRMMRMDLALNIAETETEAIAKVKGFLNECHQSSLDDAPVSKSANFTGQPATTLGKNRESPAGNGSQVSD